MCCNTLVFASGQRARSTRAWAGCGGCVWAELPSQRSELPPVLCRDYMLLLFAMKHCLSGLPFLLRTCTEDPDTGVSMLIWSHV